MGFLLDWFEVELLSVLVNYTKLSTIKWSVKILCEYGSFSIDVCLFTINIFIAPTEAIIADINVCLPEIKHWDAFVLILVTDIQQSFKLIQLFIRTESFCNKNWFAWGNWITALWRINPNIILHMKAKLHLSSIRKCTYTLQMIFLCITAFPPVLQLLSKGLINKWRKKEGFCF